MAYNEHLADRVRQRLMHANVTDEKKMMGGLIFMVNEKMCIGVDEDRETGEDRLMVRVGKAAYEDLIEKNSSRRCLEVSIEIVIPHSLRNLNNSISVFDL